MPITKSAKKALRQNKTRNLRNTARKEAYKKAVKDFRKLLASKKAEDAEAKLKTVFQSLDKAAKTGVIKKNKASRLKSRLAQALAKSAKQ
ncbi:MAG: 30S ribosomal protein S20 [Candidatus Liptonbacteria bacterium]|nr:30S ribosomal protein S20 [Candidatus Liptonbacteria bacterium]